MSTTIRFQNVSFSHLATIPLIKDLTIHLERGWTGIVGANGMGKSTLLDLIAGTLQPQDGKLTISPINATVHLCPQRVETQTPEIVDFANAWDSVALKLKSQLDLHYEHYMRWSTLSPGQRKRWQIGAALWLNPTILLLDEPTNHLDADSQQRLSSALFDYQGLGVIVSHNRGLLDDLTQATIRIQPREVLFCTMAYGDAEEHWQKLQRARYTQYAQVKHDAQRAQRKLQHQREQVQQADKHIHAGSRLKNHKDSDARSVNRKARVMNAADKLSKKATAARKQSERLQTQLDDMHIEKPLGRELFINHQHAFKPMLVAYQDQELHPHTDAEQQAHALLKDVNLCIRRSDRIHLRGPNGAGKTSLMVALMQNALIPQERILYLPQELTQAHADALLNDIASLNAQQRGRVYQILAALGVDPKRIRDSKRPSPGELRKLALAFGMSQSAWLLMLDEPTNHLDLPSIERLESALYHYPGAMVIISHDDYFARQCTRTVWHLDNTTLETTSAALAAR